MQRSAVAVSLVVLCLLAPAVAGSTGPARNSDPPVSGLPAPDPGNNFVVLIQQLHFDLLPDYTMRVTAVYALKNSLDQLARYAVAFPYPEASSRPKVTVAGKEVVPAVLAAQDPRSASFINTYGGPIRRVDPINGALLPPLEAAAKDLVNLAVFPVELPPLGSAELSVTYAQASGSTRNLYANEVRHFGYLLRAADLWQGFGTLEVKITVPSKHFFAANLPMNQAPAGRGGTSVYTLKREGPPADFLSFSLMPRRGILFGLVNGGDYELILLGLGLVSPLCAGLAGGLWGLRRHRLHPGWATLPLASGLAAALAGLLTVTLASAFTLLARNDALTRSAWQSFYLYAVFLPGLLLGAGAAALTYVLGAPLQRRAPDAPAAGPETKPL